MKTFSFISSLALSSLIFLSCNGDSNNQDTRVVKSSLSDRVIQVGQSTVLNLGIIFDSSRSRLFDNIDDVKLVVKLPPGLRYRPGTAEIQGLIDDEGVNPVVTICDQTGEQYLDFNLDGDDLRDAKDPSGSAEAEIRLTLDAISATDIGIIEAKADEETPLFNCGSFFASDLEESIQIVP